MSPIICLDAGHYGKYNRSPAVKSYYESEMNWKLHLLLKKYLEKYGFKVILTREDQTKDMLLTARGKAAKGCDLFMSIHSNAAGSKVNEEVDYPIVYVPISGSVDDLGKRLALCIEKTMGTTQEGKSKPRKSTKGNWDYYSVIHGAASVGVPGIILEHSFHTNTKMTNWLLDDNNLDKMARAEAEVLANYYGMQKEDDIVEKWYRIREAWDKPDTQKGAYLNLDLAKNNCPDGYSVFDWNGVCVYYNDEEEFTVDPKELFICEVQDAIGAKIDGIAGPETLSKTITVSKDFNPRHPVVKAIQKYLYTLGYTEVGKADGIAGPKFTAGVKHYQSDIGCTPTGMLEEWGKTWQKMLGLA